MAKLSHTDSRRMYSWWWDSHISPKNSKWLQENLTDMDAKVKVMIKLIEEDADSFARRAEMYYKKRPELMKMVEEFYRAYRALAERYDHATGVIRHAHRTMTEAFPNQLPSLFADDSVSSGSTDPRTPEISTTRVLSDDDMSNFGAGLSSSGSHAIKYNGEFTSDSDTLTRRRALKPLKDSFGFVEKVRKGLNFDETEDKVNTSQGRSLKPNEMRESDEILIWKETISKLESEKEVGLVRYQESLDKLSQLQSEISQIQKDFGVFSDRATKAENEVIILKESLSKLEAEKNSKLHEYQKCLDRLSDLEASASISQKNAEEFEQKFISANNEAQSCKVDRDKLASEKDEALNQYMQSLEIISNLESKLRCTEEDAIKLKERAANAENEVKILTQTISKLNDEKKAAALQYQQCLEMIASLERKLSRAQEEAKILNVTIDDRVFKLKGAEEHSLLLERSNKSLSSELESLMLKMGTQTQELTEKQKEVGQLWARMQEESLRFVEAETAFQTLQHLHAQTQDELRIMASELQKRSQLLKVSQTHCEDLQNEVLKVVEQNKHLDQLNVSSSLSMSEMKKEISILKESKGDLEEEVEFRLDQRNALQQEIYCLKEELNDLNMKHLLVLDQVNQVGLKPESFGSSIKELQEENINLKETSRIEISLKAVLLEKLQNFEQLLEKNSVLETTLSDLNAELDAVRGKVKSLELSLQKILEEKSTLLDDEASLMTQIQETNKNLATLSESNSVLLISLSVAQTQFQNLMHKSKMLEDSCKLLENEKAGLINEKHGLASELENSQVRLEELGKIYKELEGRCIALEKERDSNLHKAMELQMSLDVEKQEHAKYIQLSKSRFIDAEAKKNRLHEDCQKRRRELDEMLDGAIDYEIELFVLHRISQDLAHNNLSLLMKNQKLLGESTISRKMMMQLEKENLEQQVEIKLLSDQASRMRAGTYQLMNAVGMVQDPACVDKYDLHQVYFDQLLHAIQSMNLSLCKTEEESQQWAVELSVMIMFIRQLRFEAQNMEVEKSSYEHELKERTNQLSVLQKELLKHLKINEGLSSKLMEGDHNSELLTVQIEDLQRSLMSMQDACSVLQKEKSEVHLERSSLTDKYSLLEKKNQVSEEENYVLCGELLASENLSMIFRTCAEERLIALQELHDANCALLRKLILAEGMSDESKTEISHLKEQLDASKNELKIVTTEKDQLSNDFENGKTLLYQIKFELLEAEQKINVMQKELLKHLKINEELSSKLMEGDHNNELLTVRIEDLQKCLMDMQNSCSSLQKENSEVHLERSSLTDKYSLLEKQNQVYEDENYVLCGELLALDNLSMIFRNCAEERLISIQELHDANHTLLGKLILAEGMSEESKTEISHLKKQLDESENELKIVTTEKEQLSNDFENGKTLLHQIKLDLQEAGQKINVMQKELPKHLKINEELSSKLMEGDHNNELLMVRIEDLQRSLLDVQESCSALQKENSEVHLERSSWTDKYLLTEKKNQVFEEEHYVLCGELLALDNLSTIFRNCAEERLIAIQELHDVNHALLGKLISAEGMSEESKTEISRLKEQFDESKNELKIVTTEKEQLGDDFENGKTLLHQIKLDLQEAEQKINVMEKEKSELHKTVEDLTMENNEVKIIIDDQENQIIKLSTNNDQLSMENNSLREAGQMLENKLIRLHAENSESKSLGENLKLELERKNLEIDELEVQAGLVFGQLQYSMVSQILFMRKLQELHDACLGYIDQNDDLKNQLATLGSGIFSLKECVASLENHRDLHFKHQHTENEKLQGAGVSNDLEVPIDNLAKNGLMLDTLSDLRDLHIRLQAIEKASVSITESMVQENAELRSKLDDSRRQVELLKSENARYHRNLKQTSEISEEDLLTKDIMLDQVSNGSPYGASRREPNEVENQLGEPRETAKRDDIGAVGVGKPEKLLAPSIFNDNDLYGVHSMKKSEFFASDEVIDKQLNLDNLDISKRFTKPFEKGSKKKVLERLDSDVQKLANLQITVQDLKRKLQVTEKGKLGKAVIECEALKGQLEEADKTIIKLFDFNGKLTKNVEDCSFLDAKLSFDFEGDVNNRRRISEQAQRMSEKIGRLQLEVKKLQFILLKLDDKKEGLSVVVDTKRRILLRDYLYGGRRTGVGNKTRFCGCIQPSTSD